MPEAESAILFDPERLAAAASALARRHQHHLTLERRPLRPLHPVLTEANDVLLATYRALAESARRDEEVLPAGEWILDNFYVIQEQARQIREHLPPAYYRKLPRLTKGSRSGLPRVYELVRELALFTDDVLDMQDLTLFVQAYQKESLLALSELWAVPIMARLVLVEHLAERARELLAARRTRRSAATWAALITEAARRDATRGVHLLGRMAEAADATDPLFLITLARGLEADGLTEPEQAWLTQQFHRTGLTLEAAQQHETQRQAQQQVSVANAVVSLRTIAETDWSAFVEGLSVVEQTLRLDPAGVYAEMDAPTRNRYRSHVEHLAEHAPHTEYEVARQTLLHAEEAAAQEAPAVSRHVGWYLIGDGAPDLERALHYRPPLRRRLRRLAYAHASALFFGTIGGGTLLALALPLAAASAGGASAGLLALIAVAALLPAIDLAVALTNWIAAHTLPPRVLPKMAFEDGIPADHQTLVVVPTLLTSPEQARTQVAQLEVRALANPDPALIFALLTGFPDASERTQPGDDETLAAARTAIRALNAQHGRGGDRFFLLHQGRHWNPQQGVWMEWERKRGKLEELNRLLRDPQAETHFTTVEGDFAGATAVEAIRYVITLDADTRLPPGSARDLVRTAAHPFNHPRFDAEAGRVVEGYGVLQPRISILPEAALRTPFARLFCDNVGVDPYTTAVSDTYQDLFGEGIYTGKGLYHVDAFRAALDGAMPQNTVLSHDLLEGVYTRVALMTDVELFDDHPSTYLSFAKRLHRWIRGDWQILPWLLRRVPAPEGRRPNPLTPVARWKIFDNLRRSLTPPALLAFFLLGWFVLPGRPWAWTLLALFVLAFPIFAGVTSAMVRRARHLTRRQYARMLATDAVRNAQRAGLVLVLLPHQAVQALDAVGRTLWRVFVSHTHRLSWVAASQTEQNHRSDLSAYLRALGVAPALALAVLVALAAVRPGALPPALPVLLAWLIAPGLAWRLGRPRSQPRFELPEADRRRLRTVARRTWAYFDRYVGPSHGWLPPDNVQEEPPRSPAPRTSPTNIGLGLLSTQAAYDLGFVPRHALLHRLNQMLGAVASLDRYRGHLYNWYSTRDHSVLPSRYVSTVDSGNLAACLLTLKQACLETRTAPWPNPRLADGLRATLDAVREELAAPPATLRQTTVRQLVASAETLDHLLAEAAPRTLADWWSLLGTLRPQAQSLCDAVLPRDGDAAVDRLGYWLAQPLAHLEAVNLEFRTLFSFHPAHAPCPPALTEVSSLGGLHDTLREQMAADPSQTGWEEAAETVAGWMETADRLARRCDALVAAMDFGFLYHASRGLFAVGFNEDRMALDASTYDLLASEARVASFLAIAQGAVPPAHWFHLSRRLTEVDGRRVLVSWGGTMFEYLMPLLFMRRYEATLLDETYANVVYAQRRDPRADGRPWGASESGYYMLNLDLDYQYRAFGAPELGLRRGLAEDYVIAPYATMLALLVDPEHALANLQRLRAEDAYGTLGYYEAVDYTPVRLTEGAPRKVVRSYMAHHQGMSLLALAGVLGASSMQQRFHADALVRSCELLLQERLPKDVPLTPLHALAPEQEPSEAHAVREVVEHVPFERLDDACPHVHLLSNGRFRTLVTAAGAGYAAHDGVALTAWRPDRTRDADGIVLYVRDRDRGTCWSMGHQPTQRPADRYDVWFHTNKVEMARVDDWIETFMEMCVSPLDDIELRRYTLTNYADEPRRLELTSYAEVVLNEPRAHAAHPAFSKLFVQTEYLPEHHALLAHRRPRSPDDPERWLVHVLAHEHLEEPHQPPEVETDRARFIGRGRSRAAPQALDDGVALSGTVGSVLDPIVSLRHTVTLGPGEKVQITFGLGAAPSREEAYALADRFDNPYSVDRAFNLARVYGLIQLQNLSMEPEDAHTFQRFVGALLYDRPELRAPAEVLARNQRQQSGLWAYGISGDLPLVVMHVAHREALHDVQTLLKAHAYWHLHGLDVDLLLLNEHPPSYVDELQHALVHAVESAHRHTPRSGSRHVYVRRRDEMSAEDLDLIESVARIVLHDALPDAVCTPPPAPPPSQPSRTTAPPRQAPVPSAAEPAPDGYGRFDETDGTYVLTLTPQPDRQRRPPLPWSNVIANPSFGFLTTETGAGFTWSLNSRENRLTPWSNDPVRDPHDEALYVRDDETGTFWSAEPGPAPAEAPYEVRHGFGYSRFAHVSHDLEQEVVAFVPRHDPLKIVRLRLTNRSDQPRRLSVVRYQAWVLGVLREESGRFVVTEHDAETGALLATNAYNNEFAGRVAFAAVVGAGEAPVSHTADRTAFLGRHGRMAAPAALRSAEPLDGRTGAGLDPCAAFQVPLQLEPGQTRTLAFLLGEAPHREAACALVAHYAPSKTRSDALADVQACWQRLCAAVQVATPVPAIDRMMNGWLVYQTLACRLWARSAFYQSGGAYGFRDQLQDAAALVYVRPDLTRRQLLLHAAHQFVEGDVLHWWHPPTSRGIRTRITDDLLWLPYVMAFYVHTTGDHAVLDEEAPFLSARALEEGEDEAYLVPEPAGTSASLYEHACRAIDRSLTRGPHGLPLMGAGDWNDGMNRVGHEGRGESVWLGFFLYKLLDDVLPLCRARGDDDRAQRYDAHRTALAEALNDAGWDGRWYRRAYYDDGTPLGSAESDECRIDAIAQAWAVLSGAAPSERAEQAMAAVEELLINEEEGLIRLLTPPFDHTPRNPGYIKGYVPGVRENGGQYTHAALWVVAAFARLGRGDRVGALLKLLSPADRGTTTASADAYQVEPYVVAADVYGVAPHVGRGGWTWYTGSAGWMYRVGLEALLGLRLVEGRRLVLSPCIPSDWPGFTLTYHLPDAGTTGGDTAYVVNVRNPDGVQHGVVAAELDGRAAEVVDATAQVPLVRDGGTHRLTVTLGVAPGSDSASADDPADESYSPSSSKSSPDISP